MQRLLPPKLVLLLTVTAVVLTLALPSGPALPWVVRLLGLAPLAAGMVLNVGSAAIFQRVGTNIKTFNDPGTIVAEGPFRFTRNPMYLGFLSMMIGVAVLIGSWPGLVAPVGFWLAANHWYIPFEEARMRERFGADYERYAQRVPRWVGRRPVAASRPRASA